VEGLEGGDYDGSSLNSPERNVGNFSEVPEKLLGFELVSYKYKRSVTLYQPVRSKCRVGGD
jgi:hypothetical protein